MRVSTIALGSTLAASAFAATVCNGDAALCERLYSNVTYVGTHNSYSVGTALPNNQLKDVTEQLNDGVRALQVQVHLDNNVLSLCHSVCALQNSGPFQAYLEKVASWLNSNPTEVVTMIIVNGGNKPASDFAAVFQAAGLDQKAYTPPSASLPVSGWPTLGNLLDTGKQLVVFMNSEANFEAAPFIIDEFSNIWEDAYDVTDQSFGCAVNRTTGDSNSQMYMINHFLDKDVKGLGGVFVPNREKLNETNAATGPGSVGFHVDNCLQLYGRNPNIILLDYYDSNGAAPFEAVNQLNGVAAPKAVTPADYAPLTASSGSGGSSPTGSGSSSDANVSTSALPGSSGMKISPAAALSISVAVLGAVAGALVV